MGPGDLDQLLRGIEFPVDDRVLVGMARPDDAGVYLAAPGLALVQTVDLITPVSDDPFTFGRTAAANSLSDVYAMGGRPLTALAVMAFPVKDEPAETFRAILRGALFALSEAGAVMIGGHSVDDPELKFGLSVTGAADPDRLMTKGGARAGDVLVLTKALGTGVISTALKNGAVAGDPVTAAEASMACLNRDAAEAALAAGVCCATDVTGFGLGGHLREMVLASRCDAELRFADLPLLPGALALAADGWSPGGTKRNRDFAGCLFDGLEDLPPGGPAILFDPQTSGGLLLAVPAAAADALLRRLRDAGHPAAAIGRFTDPDDSPRIEVR